jgi:hypothetical protein
MRVNGATTRHMAKVFTNTVMELATRDPGTKTCSMVRAQSAGQTVLFSLANIWLVGKTESVNTSGLTELSTRGNGKTTRSQGMVTISGQTVANTLVIGRAT